MSGALLRPAKLEDAEAISRLLDELEHPAPPEVLRARLQALAAAGERVLVAEIEGVVRGLATVHVTPVLHRPAPVGRITALVVSSEMRRQGVGRALVGAAEAIAREAGARLIEVTSNRRRTQAHRFYEGLGYELTSHRFGKRLT